MLRYSIFFIFLLSCSQSFIERTQNVLQINGSVSYNEVEEGILLKWESQSDFVTMEVLRGSSDTDLKPFKSQVIQTELMDLETIAGQDYYYKINAYNFQGNQIGASKVLKGKRAYRSIDKVITPFGGIATAGRYSDRVELIWAGDAQDRFRVYRSDKENGNFVRIAEVGFSAIEEFIYRDTNVKPASAYFYKISVVGKSTNTDLEKYHSSVLKGSTTYAPTGLVATKGSMDSLNSINLKWDNDTSVDFFRVYRSTSTNGEYKLIAPFVLTSSYKDSNLPTLDGEVVEGTFTYPSYFYKIQAVKSSENSGLSAFAEGSAINGEDILVMPQVNLIVKTNTFPYKLDLSWDAIDVENVSYEIVRTGSSTTNKQEITKTNAEFDSGALHSTWVYEIRPINNKAGGVKLPGKTSIVDYRRVTPAPLTNVKATTNKMTYTTNKIAGTRPIYAYYHWGELLELPVGTIIEEWTVTPNGGFVDVAWTGSSERIDGYNIYRRRQGTTEWKLIKSNHKTTNFQDTNFTSAEYAGSGTGDKFAYPLYEYDVRPSAVGTVSGSSSTLGVGSAVNPTDILPAPPNMYIPGHWAKGTGFGRAKWSKGPKTPSYVNLPANLGGVNHMYLTWGAVNSATEYRVRHSRGESKESWYENPDRRDDKSTIQYFNNETTTDSMTGLYVFSDSLWFSYSAESAGFEVASVNGRAKRLVGGVRGIVFREASSNPFK